MKVEIKTTNADIPEAERCQLTRQAYLMLGRFSNRLDRVSIHLTGGGSGDDAGTGELTVRVVVSRRTVAVDHDRDPGAALSRAVRRIEQNLSGYSGTSSASHR